MFSPVVAIHCGVGIFDKDVKVQTQSLLESTLRQASKLLKEEKSNALTVCTETCRLLEDSALTNAGIGSNLTNQGSVELDATVMTSEHEMHGSVGALPGFKNPVLIARKLIDEQLMKSNKNSYLVPPSFLAGANATEWCLNMGFSPYKDLITNDALASFKKSQRCLKRNASETDECLRKDAKCHRFSTVGVVAVNQSGNCFPLS